MFSSKKPYSAITVTVERLTSEQYEVDDLSGLPDLVEAVKIQETGPPEASRAIRKKLKYGNVHRQLRALALLDGLIQNAGPRFQRSFADEALLERLRVSGTSDLSNPEVKKACRILFDSWSKEYKNTPGLQRIAGLSKQLPRRKQQVTQQQSKALRETEENPFRGDEEEEATKWPSAQSAGTPTSPPSSSTGPRPQISHTTVNSYSFLSKKSNKDKDSHKKSHAKKRSRPFNLEAEKNAVTSTIAGSSIASTNLLNALRLINREHQRVSENEEAMKRFENCKQLRRRVLYYIQHVEHEEWLGGLIHANDELVTALMTFEQLDRSIDADSDSEDEIMLQALRNEGSSSPKGKEQADMPHTFAGLSLNTQSKSAAPKFQEEDEEEDENDPFADRNAVVETPQIEKREPKW